MIHLNFIRYVIINEDSTINIYNFNDFNSIGNLPVLMTCEGPDDFLKTIKSNNVVPVSLEVSQIKPKRKLDSGNITSIDQLNHFSDIHLATKISKRKFHHFLVNKLSYWESLTALMINLILINQL